MIANTARARMRHRELLPIVGALLLLSETAGADPFEGPESIGKWNLAITVAGGGGVDGTKIAADDNACAFATSDLCSGENFEYGLLQFDFRVFTPQQADLPGQPRFFIRGGFQRKFGKDVAVKVEPVSESVFIRSAKAEQKDFIWDAGLGIAFPMVVREHPLQIELSVNYGQEPIDATARFADDDAGRFKTEDELKLSFLREMIEVSAPFSVIRDISIDGVAGVYLQHTLTNQKSKQRRFRVTDFVYEKSLGFGAFVGIRVTLGRET